ncbi:hypothetical protein NEOLEDRAFT_1136289 [Neolentinus lepideus HHB14362 ss-1]|uniref:Uncharacterized protein n=1 Tax=Neolentinus lepideus HHB14362 ss-1 TaxID=1314782 RepID=A0A165RA14_9AGAM|nr:hypothetical protein NEOLEDRAFT_1136289 [Neolentinus lepideus HHB14362 ss-1]
MTTIQSEHPMTRNDLIQLQRANLQHVAKLHRIKANQKTHVIIDQLLEKHPQGVVLQGVSLPLCVPLV